MVTTLATTRKRQSTSKPQKSKVSMRQVTVETFGKWQRSFEKDYASLEWLMKTTKRSRLFLSCGVLFAVDTCTCTGCRLSGIRTFHKHGPVTAYNNSTEKTINSKRVYNVKDWLEPFINSHMFCFHIN